MAVHRIRRRGSGQRAGDRRLSSGNASDRRRRADWVDRLTPSSRTRERLSWYALASVPLLGLAWLVVDDLRRTVLPRSRASPPIRELARTESGRSGEPYRVSIALPEADSGAEFDRLADELGLTDAQRETVESAAYETVDDELADVDVGEDTREAIANAMAAIIRQEISQIEDSYG